MDALAKLQELYKLRDTTIDQISKIESILGGAVETKRAAKTCSTCGQEGHTSRTCSQRTAKESEEA